jgi:hypothetical protein
MLTSLLRWKSIVRTQYTRLFTASDGGSRFEDVEVELKAGLAVPPADPLHVAPFLPTEGSFWVGAPTTWRGDVEHPAPRRQIFVTDTTGRGHSTRITSAEDCLIFAVALGPLASPLPPSR